jgi:histidinol-phosphate aminotransferase
MELERLIRDALKKYAQYEPAEQVNEEGWIKLNSNENPFPPIPEVIEDLKIAIEDSKNINIYPDPLALEVRKAVLNQLLRDKNTLTDRNTVFIGNGTDDILDIIFKVFVDPGDEIVIFYPTYGMYRVLGNLYNAKINEVKLDQDFSIPDEIYSVKGKLLFINSPNDPNGKSFENFVLEKICETFPGIVIIDENYADFSEYTALPLLKQFQNLIVIRSFSKTFSLASLRLGYALANAKIIKEMNRVKLPYNTNYFGQIAALSSIKHRRKVFEQNNKIINERKRVSENLNKYPGINVMPSNANFIYIKFEDQSKTLKFYWDLRELKILVKHFSKPNLYNYLRVTIGIKEDNDKFLNAFSDIAAKYL